MGHPFLAVWLVLVLAGIVGVALIIRDAIRTGILEKQFRGWDKPSSISRAEEPFAFWSKIVGRGGVILIIWPIVAAMIAGWVQDYLGHVK